MSVCQVARVFSTLTPEHIKTLIGIEQGMARYEFVPVEEICKVTGLHEEKVRYCLEGLNRLKLIMRNLTPFEGYILNSFGYDVLALHAAVRANVIKAVGIPLGVGKEADVYRAKDLRGREAAVKFHRLGRISFRQVRKSRGYIGDRRHISWIYRSRLAAEKEFEALNRAYRAGVSVPRPIYQNRHMVVMGAITGAPLYKLRDLEDPARVLRDILRNVRIAYTKAGIIHADLSEYNVLIKENGKVLIIDWPQCVPTTHQNADFYIARDLKNLLSYFKRKHGVEVDFEKASEYVRGYRRRLDIKTA